MVPRAVPLWRRLSIGSKRDNPCGAVSVHAPNSRREGSARIDGQQQREALNAAERALTLLGKGRTDDALSAAGRAAELDQVDLFGSLPEAVAGYVAALDQGTVAHEHLAALKLAVGPGPLAGQVDKLGGEPQAD